VRIERIEGQVLNLDIGRYTLFREILLTPTRATGFCCAPTRLEKGIF
jgi:hypothetical protein